MARRNGRGIFILAQIVNTAELALFYEERPMNKWNIPAWLEVEVIARDACCVYCGIKFGSCGARKSKASWEHITNDARIVTRDNIALCCVSCNASKGAKRLAEWMTSAYCKNKNISLQSVAEIVKRALEKPPSWGDK
jgi:hypothetical protein